MKCKYCNRKLIVQQTILIASQNKVQRRRFCPACRMVYITEETVKDSYSIEKEQSNLSMMEY